MSDWSVLGRADPAPGDVVGTRALGEGLLRRAGDVETQAARLRMLADDRTSLQMAGDYASAYAQTLEVLPGDLNQLSAAYRGCGAALTTYANTLSEAKARGGSALQSGEDADLRYRSAMNQLRLLLPRAAQLSSGAEASLNVMTVEAITVGLDAGTQEQIQIAVRQAQNASHDLAQARNLADQAAALRSQAEDTCIQEINHALDDSGLKNNSWLQKELQEFRGGWSWRNFIKACREGALVAGILAIVITGPIGLSLAMTALAASSIVLADGTVKYAEGQIGIGELAFDALGVIPAGGGFVGAARLGRMATVVRESISESVEAATLTGRIARAAENIGRATTDKTPQTLEKIQKWLPDVNPGYIPRGERAENCGRCAEAVWKRLQGEEAVAGLGSYDVPQMEAITGVRQVSMKPSEIADALKARGPGSHAVVGIDREKWLGHWFNAYYDGHKVVAIDGQSGKILDWPPDFSEPKFPVTNWDAGVLP